MLTVHMRQPAPGAGKITVPITFEREGSDGKRFVAAPLSVTNIGEIFQDNTALKRGETEVKGERRRILLEDAIPCPITFDATSGIAVGKHGMVKMHSVIEIPWTTPIGTGNDPLTIVQRKTIDSLIRLHVASLLPRLVVTGTIGAVLTGFESAVTLDDPEYVNSPIVRATYGLSPYSENQELGSQDATVE